MISVVVVDAYAVQCPNDIMAHDWPYNVIRRPKVYCGFCGLLRWLCRQALFDLYLVFVCLFSCTVFVLSFCMFIFLYCFVCQYQSSDWL